MVVLFLPTAYNRTNAVLAFDKFMLPEESENKETACCFAPTVCIL